MSRCSGAHAQEPTMNQEIRDLILSAFEASLEAQLRAVRRLRQGDSGTPEPRPRKSLSHVDMAFDILKTPCSTLHICTILERLRAQFGVIVDSESLVSEMPIKVVRGDRSLRSEKN